MDERMYDVMSECGSGCVCVVVDALHSRSFALNVSFLFVVVSQCCITFITHRERRSTEPPTVKTSGISSKGGQTHGHIFKSFCVQLLASDERE